MCPDLRIPCRQIAKSIFRMLITLLGLLAGFINLLKLYTNEHRYMYNITVLAYLYVNVGALLFNLHTIKKQTDGHF